MARCYTTNAIESVNARLRKIIKTRGHFPSDDAASKLIWLALRNITADWGKAAHHWKEAMNSSRTCTRNASPGMPDGWLQATVTRLPLLCRSTRQRKHNLDRSPGFCPGYGG